MHAIVKLVGKQHIIKQDEIFKSDKVKFEAGETFEISDVLAIGEAEEMIFGTPLVEGAKVKFEVLENKKDKKVIVFKKKRRKRYEVKNGHRQQISILKVVEITK